MTSFKDVDYNLRLFRLIPSYFPDKDKSMLSPFVDNTHIFKALLIKVIVQRVQQSENIEHCIMSIGFQDFYAKQLCIPFETNKSCWQMLSLSEWLNGWFGDILEKL